MALPKTGLTSFGAFSDLFQYTYADVIIKLLDTVDDVEKWIDSVSQEDWNGGDSQYYLYKTAGGSGSRFVNGGPGAAAPVLPVYNPPSYDEAAVRLFPHMDIVEITGPKLIRAHEKPGMYRQIMDELVSDAKNSHRNRIGPKYWGGTQGAALPGAAGFANSGVIGVIPAGSGNFTANAGSANPNVTVRQRETDTTLTNTKAYMGTYAGARYMRAGMQVQIGTQAQLVANTGTNAIVLQVDQAAQTMILDTNLNNNAAQMFVVEGDANGNEWGNCVTGLADAIDDIGTYHGIDRATATPWQSFITRNGNNLRDFNHWRITSLLMRMR